MTKFVAAKGSEQRETATLLIALATEKGIDPWEIRVVQDGYEVPDELLNESDKAVLGVEADEPKKADVKVDEKPEEPEKPAPKRRGRPPKAKVEPKVEDEEPQPGPQAVNAEPEKHDAPESE